MPFLRDDLNNFLLEASGGNPLTDTGSTGGGRFLRSPWLAKRASKSIFVAKPITDPANVVLYDWIGFGTAPLIGISALPSAGQLALSPTAPTLARTANRSITPPQGNLALSPTAPIEAISVVIAPPMRRLSISHTPSAAGRAPVRSMWLARSKLSLLELNPNHDAVLDWAGFTDKVPSVKTTAVLFSGPISLQPPQGNLALSPTAGTVARTDRHAVTPVQGNLALSPTAPIAARTARVSLVPAAGQLALSPTAPTAIATAYHWATPTSENLTLSATAPATLLAFARLPPRRRLSLAALTTTPYRASAWRGGLRLRVDGIDQTAAKDAWLGWLGFTDKPPHVAVQLTAARAGSTLCLPSSRDLAFSPAAPSITLPVNHFAVPGFRDLALSPTPPTVARTDHHWLTETGAQLVLSPTAPSAARTANHALAPAAGQLALSPTAGTVARTAKQFRTPASGNLALSPTAPSVVRTLHHPRVPVVGELVLSLTPPTAVQVLVNHFIFPAAADRVLSTAAPSIRRTASTYATPLARDLGLSPTPAIAVRTEVLRPHPVNVPIRELRLTAQSPDAALGGIRSTRSGELVLTGSAPTLAQQRNRYYRGITITTGAAIGPVVIHIPAPIPPVPPPEHPARGYTELHGSATIGPVIVVPPPNDNLPPGPHPFRGRTVLKAG
jgi:hypothetical protein